MQQVLEWLALNWGKLAIGGLGAAALTALGTMVSALAPLWTANAKLSWEIVEERDREIIALRSALMRASKRETAYAVASEIVLLAIKLPLNEQIEELRRARSILEHGLTRPGGGSGGG